MANYVKSAPKKRKSFCQHQKSYICFVYAESPCPKHQQELVSLFIREIFLESSFVFQRASLQHQNNSRGSGICRNLCSRGALIQLPMRANLVDGGKQTAPRILGWTGCVFWTIWRCLLQQLDIFFRGFFFYTGVSTLVSGT